MKAGPRSIQTSPKTFLPGGRGCKDPPSPACASAAARVCAQSCGLSFLIPSPQCGAFCPAFRHCLAAMARVAKALQIFPVRERPPVPVVGLYMVYICGPGADAVPCAFPAKWLAQKLGWPKILRPLRREVHPMPGLGCVAAPGAVFWLMGCAVSIWHQGAASRMPARPEGFLCHRAITSGQNKKPMPTSFPNGKIIGTGLTRSTGQNRY